MCAHFTMACLLLPVVCLLVATYCWFRAHDETLVISGVVTSYLSDGALATSNSRTTARARTGAAACSLSTTKLVACAFLRMNLSIRHVGVVVGHLVVVGRMKRTRAAS